MKCFLSDTLLFQHLSTIFKVVPTFYSFACNPSICTNVSSIPDKLEALFHRYTACEDTSVSHRRSATWAFTLGHTLSWCQCVTLMKLAEWKAESETWCCRYRATLTDFKWAELEMGSLGLMLFFKFIISSVNSYTRTKVTLATLRVYIQKIYFCWLTPSFCFCWLFCSSYITNTPTADINRAWQIPKVPGVLVISYFLATATVS